jgi:predicted Zn finger-like uncharacterized protein
VISIQCSSCEARYHYDESRFVGAAVKKIKCTKCATVFEIRNPATSIVPSASAARPAAGPAPNEFSVDETAPAENRKGRDPHAAAPGAPLRRMPMPDSEDGTGVIGRPESAPTTEKVPVPDAMRSPAARPLRLPSDQRLSLACIEGPDSGRIFEIDKPRVVIGRANADITVADIQCSRHHAAIEVQDEHVFVVDLNSTNGTYVNDQKVNRVELENRTEFEIGMTTLMLIRRPASAIKGVRND